MIVSLDNSLPSHCPWHPSRAVGCRWPSPRPRNSGGWRAGSGARQRRRATPFWEKLDKKILKTLPNGIKDSISKNWTKIPENWTKNPKQVPYLVPDQGRVHMVHTGDQTNPRGRGPDQFRKSCLLSTGSAKKTDQ